MVGAKPRIRSQRRKHGGRRLGITLSTVSFGGRLIRAAWQVLAAVSVFLRAVGMGNRVGICHVCRAFHDDYNYTANGYRQDGYPERQHCRKREDIDTKHRLARVNIICGWQHAHEYREAWRNQRSDQQDLGKTAQDYALESRRLAAVMQSLEVFFHRRRITSGETRQSSWRLDGRTW